MSTIKEIKLEPFPKKAQALVEKVNDPSEIDKRCNELGIPAILANYELAAPINLSYLNIGLSSGVHIPKQITEREGGRKSLYRLPVGKGVTAGIITSEDGMMLREVARITGKGDEAQDGDLYRERLLSRDGVLIYEGEGELKITNKEKGEGEILLQQTATKQIAEKAEKTISIWIVWSCIKIDF